MIKQTPLAIVIGALLSAPAVAEETTYSFDEVVVSATRLNTQTIDTASIFAVLKETASKSSLMG